MSESPGVVLRPIEPGDFDEVHRLNEDAVPHVGTASARRMKHLIAISEYARVPLVDGKVAGFILAMGPGIDYDSENYSWFCVRYPEFIYVDRIVVAEEFRGCGVGRSIYDDLVVYTSGRAPVLICEVNTRPMNEESLQFHRALGFEQVGSLETEGGKKSVALLAKTLD